MLPVTPVRRSPKSVLSLTALSLAGSAALAQANCSKMPDRARKVCLCSRHRARRDKGLSLRQLSTCLSEPRSFFVSRTLCASCQKSASWAVASAGPARYSLRFSRTVPRMVVSQLGSVHGPPPRVQAGLHRPGNRMCTHFIRACSAWQTCHLYQCTEPQHGFFSLWASVSGWFGWSCGFATHPRVVRAFWPGASRKSLRRKRPQWPCGPWFPGKWPSGP